MFYFDLKFRLWTIPHVLKRPTDGVNICGRSHIWRLTSPDLTLGGFFAQKIIKGHVYSNKSFNNRILIKQQSLEEYNQ